MQKIRKAMILAAGYGTRLKPLTNTVPKALVKVHGTPMIELVLNRLTSFGIKDIVINTHHFAGKMEQFFREHDYGVNIHLIREDEILGTGGGIRNAEILLNDSDPFVVYNVDVDSLIDLGKMEEFHLRNSPLATLAVKERPTARPLIIDKFSNVIGRRSEEDFFRFRSASGEESYLGFCGIHVISAEIFKKFSESGFFDIFTAYFRLISEGEKIIAFDASKYFWKDVGKFDKNLHA